ncbi:MAG: aquaporin [Bryobacteraceae bacterium]|nr:aquaporin [Bryobacteraceae bacterium]
MESLAEHWPEYLIEAGALGCFMISACAFAVLLRPVADPFVQRALMGLAMGATAVTIVRSPWGRRSGAHMNPAVTWNFFLLGKVKPWDAVFYAASQFAGGAAGVALARLAFGEPLREIRYAVTVPGPRGELAAFAAEFAISALLFFTVLYASNHRALSRYTPLFAGSLVALFIAFESPISGMSMNPARTFASAAVANEWTSIWIYFAAPPLGMFFASRLYLSGRGIRRVFCAKLDHDNRQRCIFRCRYGELHE